MSGRLTTGATRSLSEGEQVSVLRNQIAFLEESMAELDRRIELLVDDNAEMDFLASLNERARAPAVTDLYRENVARIEELRREIAGATDDVRLYRRILADRFGVEA